MPNACSNVILIIQVRRSGWPVAVVAAMSILMLLSGCWVSENPFFRQEDIIQDPRIVGSYSDQSTGTTWSVDPPVTDHGYYPITLTDKGHGSPARISLQGVLFRVGRHTFLNLIPKDDSGMRHIPGSPPTLSEVLHDVVFSRRGVVFKIEIVDRGVRVWIPDREAIEGVLAKERKLRTTLEMDGSLLVLNEPTIRLHALLERHPDLFNKGGDLMAKESAAKQK